MDVDCNGKVSQGEFERLVNRKMSDRGLPEDTWRSFQHLSQGRGKIVAQDLERFCNEDGTLTNIELKNIIRTMDVKEKPMMYDHWKRTVSTLAK
jgi:Ca2+-binding EF-hand superfamily protein